MLGCLPTIKFIRGVNEYFIGPDGSDSNYSNHNGKYQGHDSDWNKKGN